MTGAKHVFMQQAATANNLANASTVGFKAQEHRFRAVPVLSEAMPTRAFTVDASVADVFNEGPVMFTGRNLDLSVQGRGWLAVQLPDGSEAYTRAGSLDVDVSQTSAGTIVGTNLNVSGNVITDVDASAGSDNAPAGTLLTQVTNALGQATAINATGSTVVHGQYGDLTISADGTYTYTLTTTSATAYGRTENFTYTIN